MEQFVLILAGPSAVGKTTVMNKIIEHRPEFELVRSATTRAPRGDGNDDEYIYLSDTEFRRRIRDSEVLEHTEYGGFLYGTPTSEIERIFGEGKIPLLILDINGVSSIRKKALKYGVRSVYVYTELSVLEERLRARYLENSPTDACRIAFEKRMRNNLSDYLSSALWEREFDAFVENRDLDRCALDILSVYDGSLTGVSSYKLIAMASGK